MPEDRAITVESADDDELIVTSLEGFDEVSRGFAFSLRLVGKSVDVKPEAMLGQPLAIEAESGDPKRWFHGVVTEFRLIKVEERRAHYEAELRPWTWLMGLTCDCRIFQNLSTVEIVEEIFKKYPEAKFEKRLQGSYEPREYCVQFDESDLDFVQRLLEHEGIFYFFEYAEDGHTLVLTDDVGKLKPAEGYATVPFHAEEDPARRDRDFLSEWVPGFEMRTAAFAHTDYNFEKPGLSLMATSSAEPLPKAFAGEHYRQPGAHLELTRGDVVAALRREELQAPHVRVHASGTARGLASGCKFKLEKFPREDQNAEHFVLRADYRLYDPEYQSGGADMGGDTYRVALVAAPAALPYRPPRLTPRPVMRGPQTATVVGPAGEEIYTDKYARVKVQFHWDRLGKKDEHTTCFIRVSQTWAGSGWGFIQIPRIGQEVIVDFLEGDADRPIITGRVYNASQMPPYGLPANATQSGWKSNSSLGGGGFNELRFEDKKGSEHVYFQAEKDHNELVKNDETRLIQHDMTERVDNISKQSIGVDRFEDVGNNKETKVGVDRKVNIGNNDTEVVGNDRSLTVGGDETIHVVGTSTENIDRNHFQTVGIAQKVLVKAGRIDQVGLAEVRAVGAYQTLTVGLRREVKVGTSQMHYVIGSDSWTVGRDETVKINGNESIDIGGNQTFTLKGNQSWTNQGGRLVKVGKGQTHDVAEDVWIKAGKSMMLEAADSITLKCGDATMVLKKDGTVTIDGKDFSVNASGKINLKSTGETTLKASKINQN
jgi:type VI secretion system secreted protein VgrG